MKAALLQSSHNAQENSAQAPRGAIGKLGDIMIELRAASTSAPSSDEAAANATGGPHGRLGDIVDRLDERAFGFLILLLALPCCLPFVYLLPQIVALPMLALAGQMAAGRHHPWLPSALHQRRFSIPAFENVLARAAKYVGFVERLARPRFSAVTSHVGARIVGLLMLVPMASILVPLPSTNTAPGIGVAIAALGLIERDGVLVIIGLIFGFLWVALLAFLGLEAASLIKDWATSLF
ncbi:MAG: exopolysaccharide biosynthesis protein [Pseudomonadota bacterium]